MFRLLVCSGLPQEPSERWSASRNLMPRSIEEVISSGFGGVIGLGLGPWVASGEMCGFLVGVGVSASVGFFSVAVSVVAAPVGDAMVATHIRSAVMKWRRRLWLRVRMDFSKLAV